MFHIKAPNYAAWKYSPERIQKLTKFLLSKQGWLKKQGIEGVVVSGTSGLVIAAALAVNPHWKLPYIYVRKPNDISNSHGYCVEGALGVKNVVFIDDLIASGDTLRHTKESLKEHHVTIKLCVLYGDLWYAKEPSLTPVMSQQGVPVFNIE